MNASTQMLRQRSPRTALVCVLVSGLAASAMIPAAAQQATQPGNLIIERDVTPRDAFAPVPKSADPISVQVQTFPSGAFDSTVGAMVSDLDLNTAHGTSGVGGNGGFMQVLVGTNGVEHLLAGNGTVAGSGIPVGAGAGLGGVGGIGASVAQTVTGALAPLGAAMGALK
jgi:hypothetical protein